MTLFLFYHQICLEDDRRILSKLYTFFHYDNRLSNILVVLPAYILFLTGVVLRFQLTNHKSFITARYDDVDIIL